MMQPAVILAAVLASLIAAAAAAAVGQFGLTVLHLFQTVAALFS